MTGCHGNAQSEGAAANGCSGRTLEPRQKLAMTKTNECSIPATHTHTHCYLVLLSGSKWTQISLLCAFGIRAVI